MTSDQKQERPGTTPTDREIHIERVFDAPRERVFAAHTDPRAHSEWWGPRRPRSSTRWTSGPAGAGAGDRTKVVTTSIFHTPEERDGMLASGTERGMNETFSRLDELLRQISG